MIARRIAGTVSEMQKVSNFMQNEVACEVIVFSVLKIMSKVIDVYKNKRLHLK